MRSRKKGVKLKRKEKKEIWEQKKEVKMELRI